MKMQVTKEVKAGRNMIPDLEPKDLKLVVLLAIVMAGDLEQEVTLVVVTAIARGEMALEAAAGREVAIMAATAAAGLAGGRETDRTAMTMTAIVENTAETGLGTTLGAETGLGTEGGRSGAEVFPHHTDGS